MAELGNNDAAVVQDDLDAARRALAHIRPDLPLESSEYAALLDLLARMHHFVGTDRFELYYLLRPAKNREEEWARQLMQKQITLEELEALLKADAERPIDLEMLSKFHEIYRDNLARYSAVIRLAVPIPSDDDRTLRSKEQEIDAHIAALRQRLPLWKENLETVFEFLEEQRVTSGAGLVKVGEFEATSAHWLAQLVFKRLSESWLSSREISERSHRDPRYLNAARAIDLFANVCLERFPEPQKLSERIREEFVLTRAALKQGIAVGQEHVPTPPTAGQSNSESDSYIDNESREQILCGEIKALVGKCGHIYRDMPQADWGVDGEIEFKDGDGNATGSRLYVQLKSGDSHLRKRKDGEEIYAVKNSRHLQYWANHAYPVMLVIRNSNGAIRWMDVSEYIRVHGQQDRQIEFRGEYVTTDAIQGLADRALAGAQQDATTGTNRREI